MPTRLGPRVTIKRNDLPNLVRAIRQLADTHVMVGIPRETTARSADANEPMTNAEIGYVQEHGAPETNLPPRPHLYPTVRENRQVIVNALRIAGRAALTGDLPKMEQTLERLGLRMQTAVRRKIVAVLPPPLAEATVRGRIARRKSASWRRKRTAEVEANIAAGNAPGEGIFTPLIDTGNYLAHITYVVRSRSTKKDKVVGQVGQWQTKGLK